jgi:Leu/Phe-tRNA-protein transferase
MTSPPLRYTRSGHVFIAPGDDPDAVTDALFQSDYDEDFCIASVFEEEFVAGLMAAGFLVMSTELEQKKPLKNERYYQKKPPEYILLPKHHLERSVIFFDELHEPKSARRLIPRYELRKDEDFDCIVDNCVKTHGDDWLTPPLVRLLKALRPGTLPQAALSCFGLYRDGKLTAGEFGISAGKVYTSYSGFHTENSDGTVQMILTGRWLRDRGFAFWDLGMPLDYKLKLGARNISRERFLELFREARN